MVKTLSIFNMKGGVGKSTTAYNLADGLGRYHNRRVLLVDIDPQGNSSAALGVEVWNLGKQVKDVLQRRISVNEAILPVGPHLDLLPSNILLAEEEIPISGLPGRETLLKKALAPILENYDFIIIDSPPNIGVFSINALMASEGVIVPVDMSYLGLLGVEGIERALSLVRTALDHPIRVTGVLGTRFDGRNKLSREVLESLRNHFGESLYHFTIPETVKLREAPSFGKSIFDYEPLGRGAEAYRQLVEEVIKWH